VVWDDVDPAQRLRMYDRGIDMPAAQQAESRRETLISYRVGDMIAPALPEVEALDGVVHEFASAINQHRRPLTDGEAGLRVMRALEAASLSLERGGAAVRIET
jgi:predicted dehydrogenase